MQFVCEREYSEICRGSLVNLSNIVFIPLFNTFHPHLYNSLEISDNYTFALTVSAEHPDALRGALETLLRNETHS